MGAGRAEGDAESELSGALRDHVAEDGVKAESGEQ